MEQVVAPASAGEDLTSGNRYAGRVSIALLVVPPPEQVEGRAHRRSVDLSSVYGGIVKALEKDARVKELQATAASASQIEGRTFAAAGTGEAPLAKPSEPHRHIHGAVFHQPILLAIEVPKRLQEASFGAGSIPAEQYWATWDGVQLLVLWNYAASKKPFGISGGMVVLEIVAEAARSAGATLVVQPCGSNCEYPFAHQDLLVAPQSGAFEVELSPEDVWTTRVTCPAARTPMALVGNLADKFAFTVHSFASLRGHGASIWQTDRLARRNVAELLGMQYEHADLAARSFLKSGVMRWKKRRLPREMARLTATLWLRLATLEENRGRWVEDRYIFDRSSTRSGLSRIFATEYPQEVNGIESLDVTSLRAAVQQMSSRGDSRVIAWATAGGALAGAIVGWAVGLIG